MTSHIQADQSAGDLLLLTGRSGIGAKLGHDLTMRVGQWTAEASTDGNGGVDSLRLVASLNSLEVVRGEGGVKPLSDKDKVKIVDNAMGTMKVKSNPDLVFDASGISVKEGENTVAGQVTLNGVTQPQTVHMSVQRSGNKISVQASCELTQSDFKIKPYSEMRVGMKVRDMVEVRADLVVLAD
ncbi:MAG: YceI family protein [Actinomycetota bacterium]|jgi:polyisoprenoid-binding protein YceI|nr:YceI family protein [Actinomycetota bacterium]